MALVDRFGTGATTPQARVSLSSQHQQGCNNDEQS